MSRKESEVIQSAREILKSDWSRRKGVVVPDSTSISLEKNEAVQMEGAVLYADLAASSRLTQEYKDFFVAKIYRVFLKATTDVIRNNSGEITAFDGDRVMAVFIGDSKCSNAAKAALQIKSVVRAINGLIGELFPQTHYRIDYGVGVDVSDLFIVRTGVRGANDLAWIGDASNVAAKLSNLRDMSGNAFITRRVYNRLADSSRFSTSNGTRQDMWVFANQKILGHDVFQSSWFWSF